MAEALSRQADVVLRPEICNDRGWISAIRASTIVPGREIAERHLGEN